MPHLIALILKFKKRIFGLVAPQGFLQKGYFIFSFSFPLQAFPHSSTGKETTCNAGDPGWIPNLGRSAGEGIGYPLHHSWASFVAHLVKNPPAKWETWVRSLGLADPLEKRKVTHPSILTQRISLTLQSMNDFHFSLYYQSELISMICTNKGNDSWVEAFAKICKTLQRTCRQCLYL